MAARFSVGLKDGDSFSFYADRAQEQPGLEGVWLVFLVKEKFGGEREVRRFPARDVMGYWKQR